MADIRHMSKEFMTEFISVYRHHPALWKTKSKAYVNRHLKDVGYEALVQLYKKVDPNADRDLVSKKIQSLRGSFRKELKKYEKSRKVGGDEGYVPSLWYFDLLMFTRDQETPNGSLDGLTPEVGVEEGSDVDDMEAKAVTVGEVKVEHGHEDRGSAALKEEGNGIQGCNVFKQPPSKKMKRQSTAGSSVLSPEQQEPLRARTESLGLDNRLDYESEAFGRLVAAKHSKLTPEQRMYAEALIGNVLNKGILQELDQRTSLVGQPLRSSSSRGRTPSPSSSFRSSSPPVTDEYPR